MRANSSACAASSFCKRSASNWSSKRCRPSASNSARRCSDASCASRRRKPWDSTSRCCLRASVSSCARRRSVSASSLRWRSRSNSSCKQRRIASWRNCAEGLGASWGGMPLLRIPHCDEPMPAQLAERPANLRRRLHVETSSSAGPGARGEAFKSSPSACLGPSWSSDSACQDESDGTAGAPGDADATVTPALDSQSQGDRVSGRDGADKLGKVGSLVGEHTRLQGEPSTNSSMSGRPEAQR
mmetsp:Transcript_127002/g.270811  ORF Transcript_127002/g.270811 Transcript_127002/m.270811 type:complete len:242 (+) Transcript_127002:438-1163(+)